jgi:hypothetical protein
MGRLRQFVSRRRPSMAAAVTISIAATMFGALAGCSSDDAKRFKADPLAKETFGSAEVTRVQVDKGGTTLGKSSQPVLVRAFKPLEGRAVEAVLKEMVSAAEADGWAMDERVKDVSYLGHKTDSDGPLEAAIYFSKESGELIIRISAK